MNVLLRRGTLFWSAHVGVVNEPNELRWKIVYCEESPLNNRAVDTYIMFTIVWNIANYLQNHRLLSENVYISDKTTNKINDTAL